MNREPAAHTTNAPRRGTTLVVGVGQRLAGDDAVGPGVLQLLGELPLPPGVSLRELRDPAELTQLVAEHQRLVVVDALVGIPAGEIRVLRLEQLDPRAQTAVSSHGMGVAQALELGVALAPEPAEIVVVAVGVKPLGPELGRGLSAVCEAALPHAAQQVLRILEQT